MSKLFAALDYLHSQGLTHGDVRLETIMLTSKDPTCADVKITGLNCFDGEVSVSTDDSNNSELGAPELILDKPYTPACDMWSSGVVMYSLLSCSTPKINVSTSTK